MADLDKLLMLNDRMTGLTNYLENYCDNESPEFISHLTDELYNVSVEFDALFNTIANKLKQRYKEDKMFINVKYTRDVPEIKAIKGGDWIDLYAAEDVYLKLFESTKIPLGVVIELPKGYEAIVVPRSSTFNKYGIMMNNSIGVIDESYCGNNDEWKFPAICMTSETHIPKGARIAQFRIFKHQPPLGFTKVEFMKNEDRGGFGSTGD